MANWWGNNGNSERLYFLGLQNHCGPWLQLNSILKSRDITLLTKVCLVKTMVFPVVMYGCKSWSINKAEHWRIDVFELWCWQRLLSITWTARRPNQSIPKEMDPEYSLGELKLQYIGHRMWRADSLEKTLMLENTEGKRRNGGTEDEMVGGHHWLCGHEFEQTLGESEGQGSLVCFYAWGRKESDTN